MTCTQNRRPPRMPDARACRTKSEFRKDAAVAHNTRAELVQPRSPSSKKVTSTEIKGDTFSGINPRTATSKYNHGRDSNKPATTHATRAETPPQYPATPPTDATIMID